MATTVVLGVGAVAAAILGRSIVRHGFFVGRGAAEEFVKGGFRAKMERKEAIQILGLK
jgi:DnaJ family protein C protein 19